MSFISAQTVLSCNDAKKDKNLNAEKRVKPEDILKDFNTWYSYTYYNIKLAQDFIGLDKHSNAVKKEAFLKLLITGDFVPVKIYEKENLAYYKLYSLKSNDLDIKQTMKQMAANELLHYNMLGKELPTYNLKDLQGNVYNNQNTRGEIVVLKCWFIHCVACVKEFPELNKIVDTYKDRKDIVFISLALDTNKELSAFLKTKEFKYAVVSNQGEYMRNELKITEFPTHILVGKNGKISSVVNACNDLIPALKKEVAK